jgi:hypothetical protein
MSLRIRSIQCKDSVQLHKTVRNSVAFGMDNLHSIDWAVEKGTLLGVYVHHGDVHLVVPIGKISQIDVFPPEDAKQEMRIARHQTA